MKLFNLFPNLEFPRVRATDPISSFEAADQAKELASKHHKMIVEALKIRAFGKGWNSECHRAGWQPSRPQVIRAGKNGIY